MTRNLGEAADLASLGLDLLVAYNTSRGMPRGQRLQKFMDAGGEKAFKQHYAKAFGIGKTDEAELWKTALGLLGQIDADHPVQIRKLLAAMRDDTERADFRLIIATMAAGGTEEIKTSKSSNPEKDDTITKQTKNLLDTTGDLRVKTLEVLAKIVKNDGVEEALELLRLMGLGKENQLVKQGREFFNELGNRTFGKNAQTVLELLKKKNDANATKAKAPHPDRPSLALWLLRKTQAGAFKTPFAEVREVLWVKCLARYLAEKWATLSMKRKKKLHDTEYERIPPTFDIPEQGDR